MSSCVDVVGPSGDVCSCVGFDVITIAGVFDGETDLIITITCDYDKIYYYIKCNQ